MRRSLLVLLLCGLLGAAGCDEDSKARSRSTGVTGGAELDGAGGPVHPTPEPSGALLGALGALIVGRGLRRR